MTNSTIKTLIFNALMLSYGSIIVGMEREPAQKEKAARQANLRARFDARFVADRVKMRANGSSFTYSDKEITEHNAHFYAWLADKNIDDIEREKRIVKKRFSQLVEKNNHVYDDFERMHLKIYAMTIPEESVRIFKRDRHLFNKEKNAQPDIEQRPELQNEKFNKKPGNSCCVIS